MKSSPPLRKAKKGQVVLGPARFTFVTAHCVRLEYAPAYGFVDAPSLFASARTASTPLTDVRQKGRRWLIETATLCLEYLPDGRPFHAGNLRVNLRGKSPVTWVPRAKNPGNLGGPAPTLDEVGEPFPLPDGLLSRDGWYLIDDSGKAIFQDGWIAPRPGGPPPDSVASQRESARNPDLDWYLFVYAHDFRGALASLAAVSGRVPMPRRHVLGSWYCRWHRYTADDFRGIVREYKEHDFPIDVLVMDMDWHTQNDARTGYGHACSLGWTGYTWNHALLPDPAGLLREFKQDGIYVTLNDHPADGMRAHEAGYKTFLRRMGPGTPAALPFDAGNRRYMEAFFAAAHEPLERQGVDFWWLDWQQNYIYPWVLGVPGLRHLTWLNHLYYQRARRDGRRGQSFSRWGGWGDHRNPTQFSGDARACWAMLEFEVPFTVASGNAGCFFWAHDAGGFNGERDPETFTRWVQFCAFSASLRLHSVGDDLDRRPWLWGKKFTDAMRKAYHLRVELFPYLYTAVRQCHDETVPLLRPMYLDHPHAEEAYGYPGQYLLGDHLLVAPVTAAGQGPRCTAQKEVWFPPGEWFHLQTGERVAGGAVRSVTAEIDQVPVYVRGGVPIPMQPYTPRMTSATLPLLRVRCYPGQAGASELYEDDGQTEGYLQGHCARTALTYRQEGNVVQVSIGAARGTYPGQTKRRACLVELVGLGKVREASVDGKPAGFTYERRSPTTVVEVPVRPVSSAVEVRVTLEDDRPQRPVPAGAG